MKPLGDHLGADENVDRAFLESLKCLLQRVLSGHCIGVHPSNPRFRKEALHCVFDFLRSHARMTDARVFASRAYLRGALAMPADMAG